MDQTGRDFTTGEIYYLRGGGTLRLGLDSISFIVGWVVSWLAGRVVGWLDGRVVSWLDGRVVGVANFGWVFISLVG